MSSETKKWYAKQSTNTNDALITTSNVRLGIREGFNAFPFYLLVKFYRMDKFLSILVKTLAFFCKVLYNTSTQNGEVDFQWKKS